MFVELEDLYEYCRALAAEGSILLSLWGSDERDTQQAFILHLVFIKYPGSEKMELQYNQVKLSAVEPIFPNLSVLFPVAVRLQRALFDLLGIVAVGANDTRPWLCHQAWSHEQFPLRADFNSEQCQVTQEIYPFVAVSGDGVHEIPVGPVHAGTIEPGHFRFSVVGEKVLRLEERLGYTHKGIAKILQGLNVAAGAKVAARISGDATVAYSLAYAQAIEKATQCPVKIQTRLWRILLLERERIANHLGDLGALGNDGGLAFGLAQFSRLKENWLRTQQEIFGHRYMMDIIIPGGVKIPFSHAYKDKFLKEIDWLRHEVSGLQAIYQQHAGLQDRFVTTGRIKAEQARQLGLLGLVARASDQLIDCRLLKEEIIAPAKIKISHQKQGDVAARVAIRFQEIFHSLELVENILNSDLENESNVAQNHQWAGQKANWEYSVVESWRGPVLFALQLNEACIIQHAHVHDSSWQNWPALEYAILNNIVADFPLINKSFNLSYSGHDV